MRRLLRLYPRAWRDRYEEEMLALLEEHPATFATVIDLLIGALDAHLHYHRFTEGMSYLVVRLRSGIVMIFCAFIVFGVGWGMLQRITDPMNHFEAVAKVHPEFGTLFMSNFIIGCISFLAFLVGGLPVFYIAVKRAIKNRRKNVLIPFWIAVSCLLISILATAISANWHHIGYAMTHIYVFLGGYLVLLATLLTVGTVAVSLVISRTDYQLSELKFMFLPEVVIFVSMVIAVVCSTVLFIAITLHAPQLLTTQDVGAPMFITGIVMQAMAMLFAWSGFKRGRLKDTQLT